LQGQHYFVIPKVLLRELAKFPSNLFCPLGTTEGTDLWKLSTISGAP